MENYTLWAQPPLVFWVSRERDALPEPHQAFEDAENPNFWTSQSGFYHLHSQTGRFSVSANVEKNSQD